VGEAGVDRLDRLRGTVGQRRGKRVEASVDGLGDGLRAGVERLFERGDAADELVVERLDVAFDRAVEARPDDVKLQIVLG